MINTCVRPFTNWIALLTKNIAVIGARLTALVYPWLFIVLMIAFILRIGVNCQSFERDQKS
jgi:hypothetical protein